MIPGRGTADVRDGRKGPPTPWLRRAPAPAPWWRASRTVEIAAATMLAIGNDHHRPMGPLSGAHSLERGIVVTHQTTHARLDGD
jgi:hypothetical protein